MALGKRRRITQEYGAAQPSTAQPDPVEPATQTTTYVVAAPSAVPSRDEPNAIERAEAGEAVEVSLPISEQPDPVFGFGPFPTAAPAEEHDDIQE